MSLNVWHCMESDDECCGEGQEPAFTHSSVPEAPEIAEGGQDSQHGVGPVLTGAAEPDFLCWRGRTTLEEELALAKEQAVGWVWEQDEEQNGLHDMVGEMLPGSSVPVLAGELARKQAEDKLEQDKEQAEDNKEQDEEHAKDKKKQDEEQARVPEEQAEEEQAEADKEVATGHGPPKKRSRTGLDTETFAGRRLPADSWKQQHFLRLKFWYFSLPSNGLTQQAYFTYMSSAVNKHSSDGDVHAAALACPRSGKLRKKPAAAKAHAQGECAGGGADPASEGGAGAAQASEGEGSDSPLVFRRRRCPCVPAPHKSSDSPLVPQHASAASDLEVPSTSDSPLVSRCSGAASCSAGLENEAETTASKKSDDALLYPLPTTGPLAEEL